MLQTKRGRTDSTLPVHTDVTDVNSPLIYKPVEDFCRLFIPEDLVSPTLVSFGEAQPCSHLNCAWHFRYFCLQVLLCS